jgi:hypothetical protein
VSQKFFSGFIVCAVGLFLLAGCQNNSTPDPVKSPALTDPLSVEKTTHKGPVSVTVRVMPKRVHIADLMDLDLVVIAPSEVEVTPPLFGEAIGEFLVRKFNDTTVRAEDGTQTRTLHYQLEPTELGIRLIRTMTCECVDPRENVESKGKTVLLETDPLDVEVVGDLGRLFSLSRACSNSFLIFSLSIWIATYCSLNTAISGAAVLIVAGVGVVFWRRSRRPPPVVLTPAEMAQTALNDLLAENLPAQGLYKEFYIRLTGIVRLYIEQTTGVRAPEQTTEEFMQGMRTKMIFSSERTERLVAFLEAADMVKYAGVLPGHRQTEEAIARAQEFVGLASTLAPVYPRKPDETVQVLKHKEEAR